MNDDDMLAAMRSSLTSVKDSLADVHLDQSPDAIITRARGRRLRRGLPGIAAGALALAAGLAVTLPGSSPADKGVHVNLAAWSVNTTSAGQVDVTIRQLKDPARLSRTLARAGVPVVLTSGPVCTGAEDDMSKVVTKHADPRDVFLTITPAAMPAGTELVIGIGTLRDGPSSSPAAAFGLAKVGSPLDCGSGPKERTR
jgi:hypothetical protein